MKFTITSTVDAVGFVIPLLHTFVIWWTLCNYGIVDINITIEFRSIILINENWMNRKYRKLPEHVKLEQKCVLQSLFNSHSKKEMKTNFNVGIPWLTIKKLWVKYNQYESLTTYFTVVSCISQYANTRVPVYTIIATSSVFTWIWFAIIHI